MILITGGAGFIGSHVNLLLQEAGYKTLVMDNLSRGSTKALLGTPFIEGDLLDKKFLNQLFKSYKIATVMHFAALTDVGESCENPEIYFKNNTEGSLNLIEAMLENGVKKFIFSSTAAVYGWPEQDLINENHPLNPINPYGISKLKVEEELKNLSDAGKLLYVSLRYFNAAGGDPHGILKNNKPRDNNLIPIILKALRDDKEVTVFGDDWETPDGTCLRDYIHVSDLASAHLLALESPESAIYNLGNGKGFSVKEVIETTEKVLKKKVKWKVGPKRAGDPAKLVADSRKAQKELRWKPRFQELEKIILDAHRALP